MTIRKETVTVTLCYCDICGKDITNSPKMTMVTDTERLDACMSVNKLGQNCYKVAEIRQLIKSADFAFCGNGNDALNKQIAKNTNGFHVDGCKYGGVVHANQCPCECAKKIRG